MSDESNDHRDDAFFITSGGIFDINTTHEVRAKLELHEKPLVQTPSMPNDYANQVRWEIEADQSA